MENFAVFLICVVLFNTYLILISQKKVYERLTKKHASSSTNDAQHQLNKRGKHVTKRD